MKRKNIIFIVLLIVALITSILSLVIFVLSKIHPHQKEEAEIIYKVNYEDDSEPGATTTYYLYDNGNIMFSHKKYCSIPDCEPEIIESETLNFKEENLQIAYNYLKSLIPNGNEVTVFLSTLSTPDREMLFYIQNKREEILPLETSGYDYKIELGKDMNFYLIYLKGEKIDVVSLLYDNYELKEIKTHNLKFTNNKVIKDFILEQFNKEEKRKNIYYSNYSYKEKLILDSIIENNEEYIKDIDQAKELLYTLHYEGLNCLTPTLDIYNDNSYDYNYTYTTNGKEPTPQKGTYNYDINKLLKTTNYEDIEYHKAGFFMLKNKKETYYLSVEDIDLIDFLSTAGLTTKSFTCSLTHEE